MTETRQKVFESLREVIAHIKEMRELLDADADKNNRELLDDALIAMYKFAGTFASD